MDAFLSRFPSHPTVLDAGCGPGHQARYFDSRGATAVGLDYSSAMLREGRNNDPGLRLVQGDMTALPFPAATFDGVWARASLIHMSPETHGESLREFHGILKPGGILYAAVRQGDGDEVREELQNGVPLTRYFRFWQPEEWSTLLQSCGFDIMDRGIEDGDPEDWLWVYAKRVG